MDKKIMLKKLLIILALSIPLFGQNITGTGTSSDPYMLYNAADFDSIRYLGSTDKYYKLGNDIDFTDWGRFTHIDSCTNIDGDGYTISNMIGDGTDGLTSNYYDFHGGIFEYDFDKTVTIKNITFYKCSLTVNTTNSDDIAYVGFILARGDFHGQTDNITFDECYLSVTDLSNTNINGMDIGFITGNSAGKIQNSRIIRSKMIINVNDNSITEVGLFTGYLYNLSMSFYKNYTYKNYMYLNNEGTAHLEGGFLSGEFNGYTGTNANFAFKDTLECGTEGGGIQFGGITHTLSKGAIIGGNPIFNETYATSIFINPTADVKTDVFRINMASYDGYHDTTNYQNYYFKAQGKNTSDFLDSTYLPNLNFSTTWDHSDPNSIFEGYPILQSGMVYPDPLQTIEFLTPSLYQEFLLDDSAYVSVEVTNSAFVNFYYSADNGSTWTFVRKDSTDGTELDTLGFYLTLAESDTLLLRASTPKGVFDISEPFIYLSNKILNILSPTDSSGNFSVGNIVDILVEAAGIDSLSLFYAVGDTTTWIPIVLNLPVSYGFIDTILYEWTLPDIYGAIWIRAADVSDTSIYIFDQPVAYLGGTMASHPAICWYDSYFGSEATWQPGSKTWVTHCYIVDASCGWGYYGTRSYGAWIDDNASGYYVQGYDPAGWIPASDIYDSPYVPAPVSLFNAVDTTTYSIGSFYEFGDTVTYKSRRYYISSADTTLRCDDLRNNIDSIFVADIKSVPTSNTPVFGGWHSSFIYEPPSKAKLQVYNVQRSKISGNSYSITQNFESLNDPSFKPVILFGGAASNGRGSNVFKVSALDAPPDKNYIEDTQRIFTNLNIKRDYFRGIDPKARKSGR